jgi:propionate CoA-transferase
MGLRNMLLDLPLEERLRFDPEHNLFFVNFERLHVRNRAQIERMREQVEAQLAPLGRKVPAVVNYEHFEIEPELLDDYVGMVQDVTERFYSSVVRYATGGFTRMKLGEVFSDRYIKPQLYSSLHEARAALGK